MKRFSPLLFVVIIGIALMQSCAQIGSPTGGPKDETPPKIESSEPLNYSTSFSGKRIRLEFDEYVTINSLTTQLIISPPLKYEPEFKMKGKRVEMLIKDTLRPNTTYSINFGDGIKDITEGNPLDSNTFVFSTGPFLDSLSVSGRIKNAFDLVPVDDMLVMLYDSIADSIPAIERPLYLTKTKKGGYFQLNNLQAGNFLLFALIDANANFLYDQPSEALAFPDSLVTSGSADTMRLLSFTEDAEQQYVSSLKATQFGKVEVLFNRPAKNPRLVCINHDLGENWFQEEHYSVGDTLVYWLRNNLEVDSLRLVVYDGDSIIDTNRIKLPERIEKKDKPKGKSKVTLPELTVSRKGSGNQVHNRPFKLEANHPIRSVNFKGWLFVAEGDTIDLNTEEWTQELRTLTFNHQWKQGISYQLVIPPDAIQDRFKLSHDTLTFSFRTSKTEDFGTLELKVQLPPQEDQLLIQAMDKDGKVYRQDLLPANGVMKYKQLKPRKYYFKLVKDHNANNQWDPGEFSSRTQPEKVLIYPDAVDVRANWDLSIDWIVK